MVIKIVVPRVDCALKDQVPEGRRLGVPGVPAEAQQRRRGTGRRSLRPDSHPSQASSVGRPDLETLS